ncbi:MAG: alpha/beta hydrolase [Clostridia bacterium]|nr:alpha/beta hydrolase [Clostridia bacterium]
MLHQRVILSTSAALDVYAAPSCLDPGRRLRALVICPGGGYSNLAPREAEPVAMRFAGLGFVAFVLYYRTAPARFPAALQDAGAALKHIRTHADEYHVAPDAIAVMGFSAGGHAAGSLGVMWHREEMWQPLGLTCEQVKPNAMVLCYPVITSGPFAHRRSFACLTGCDDPAAHKAFSLENLVTANTPPTFLWHTWEDQSVPVQNSLLMAMALRQHGVNAELYIRTAPTAARCAMRAPPACPPS